MKRTYTININSRLFIIDEDAYNMLNDYQTTLRQAFSCQPDGLETLKDLESRISEIFSEPATADHIITIDEVKYMISRIGLPEEIGIEPTPNPATCTTRKRLFRDPDDKKVAGVCAGIAAYFNSDPLWIRVATVVLFLFFNVAITPIYLILWVFLPVANTPGARLQMTGSSLTLNNIAASVTSHHCRQSEELPEYSRFEKFCAYITNFCAQAFKVLLVFYGLVALLILLGAVMLNLASGCVLYDLLSDSSGFYEAVKSIDLQPQLRDLLLNDNFVVPYFISLGGLSFSVIIGIVACFIMFFNTISNKPLLFNHATRITFLIAFIIGLAIAIIAGCITFADNITLLEYIQENII